MVTKNFLGSTAKKCVREKYSISIVNYTERVSEEWHAHDKIHVSSIIKGGNLESRKSGDIQVQPGHIMSYDQGEVHRNRHTAHPSANLNIEFEEAFFQNDVSFRHLRPEPEINMTCYQLYLEFLLNDTFTDQMLTSLLKSLFWKNKKVISSDWMVKLKTILNDQWNRFPSLDELSRELNIHPVTISRYFVKNMGFTLSEYMRRIKAQKAIADIINSEDPLPVIAVRCGFSDQSHMNRLIKRYTGLRPSIIRQSAG